MQIRTANFHFHFKTQFFNAIADCGEHFAASLESVETLYYHSPFALSPLSTMNTIERLDSQLIRKCFSTWKFRLETEAKLEMAKLKQNLINFQAISTPVNREAIERVAAC